MTLSREILMQFVDGELSPDDALHVQGEIAANPDLRDFVETQAALRRDFAAAFAHHAERMPDRLTAAIANTAVSRRWRLTQMFWHGRHNIWIWTGVPAAAALAFGLVIGVLVNAGNVGPITTAKNGTLIASGALADVLTTQLASQTQPTNGPRIGVSFHAKDGRDCRTFEAGTLSGIACHDKAAWNIAALASIEPEAQGTYRKAASAMADIIRNAATKMIAGAPFDAVSERQARDRGWQAN